MTSYVDNAAMFRALTDAAAQLIVQGTPAAVLREMNHAALDLHAKCDDALHLLTVCGRKAVDRHGEFVCQRDPLHDGRCDPAGERLRAKLAS